MHPEVLAPDTAKLIDDLGNQEWTREFYLAGGTAVALLLGHRRSIDLDFFSFRAFETLKLRGKVLACGQFTLDEESPGTLHGRLNRVRVSFLEYPYPLMDEPIRFQRISLAGLRDLACMKLEAIAARGKQRDFIDLYAVVKAGHPLEDILSWFENKYQALQYNKIHLIKSLTYFEDAEEDPSPDLLRPLEWSDVKDYFRREACKMIP